MLSVMGKLVFVYKQIQVSDTEKKIIVDEWTVLTYAKARCSVGL
jgi:hypothetical protein